MDEIEVKIDQLVHSLQVSKEETLQGKMREADLKLRIKQLEEDLAKQSHKVSKYKANNENLMLTLKQVVRE